MSLKLACPRCHHVQFYDDAFAGAAVTCAKCEQAFRVPRASEPTVAEKPAPVESVPIAPVTWTGTMQARELPTSFAPTEPLSVKVVELPEKVADRTEELPRRAPVSEEPLHLERRGRVSPRRVIDEPSRLPWTFGVSVVAFLLLLFGATAAWFLARDHRPPQQKAVFNPQPFPPQFQQPMQPQPLPPNLQRPPMQGMQMPGQGRRDDPKGRVAPVEPQPNEQFIEVKLVNGELTVPGSISPNDPFDPLSPGCRRKVYLIELEEYRHYAIEMNVDPPQPPGGRLNLGQLDPYLRLEDENGKILDANDDIQEGFILDSRIEAGIRAKSKYRIIATTFGVNESGNFKLNIRDDTAGKPISAKKLALRQLPQPVKPGNAVEIVKEKQGGLVLSRILQSEAPLVNDLHWTQDGKAFFALDAQGTLRRLAWPDGIEELRLTTALPATGLSVSRAGLLVCYPSIEEVWLVEPATLEVKKRISAPGIQRITSAPTSDFAFATVKLKPAPIKLQPKAPVPAGAPQIAPPPPKAAPTEGILLLDVARGVPVRQYEFAGKNLSASPDGKYVFAEGNIERLLRYRVVGENRDMLFFDEESPRLSSANQGIFVSPDSKYVCLTAPGGNQSPDQNVTLKLYTTVIFETTDLKKAAFTIETGESPRAVGFDPKTGTVVSNNNEKQLIFFSDTGLPKRDGQLPGDDRLAVTPRQFLMHPAGGRMLVRTEHAIFDVQFGKQEEN